MVIYKKVFSVELVKILMLATQEADVLLKQIYKHHNPRGKSKPDITDYKKIIDEHHKEIKEVKLGITRGFMKDLQPFGLLLREDSNENKKEEGKKGWLWWRANNDVKHNRETEYHKASLINALNAVAAVFILNVVLYNTVTEKRGERSGKWLKPEKDLELFIPPKGMCKGTPAKGQRAYKIDYRLKTRNASLGDFE